MIEHDLIFQKFVQISFLLLVELSLLEFHPGPRLRSAEAGERLDTRQ